MLAMIFRVKRKCADQGERAGFPRTLTASYLPELGKSELGSPDLTLAAKAVSADQLEPTQKDRESWLVRSHSFIKSSSRQEKGVPIYWYGTKLQLQTYSLISFSLSKGLLGFLDVFLSAGRGETTLIAHAKVEKMAVLAQALQLFRSLTVRVLDWHLEGLIFGL